MPRIPTSKPDRAPRRPSVGGQVDIRSQDAFFRSIASASAEAGAAIEKARVEKQRAIDVKQENEIKIGQIDRESELQAALREADVSEHSKIVDEFAANSRNLTFRDGVSKEAREALQQDNELWIHKIYANSMAWSAEEADKDKRKTAEQRYSNSLKTMDLDSAQEAIRSMGLSPEMEEARNREAQILISKGISDGQKAAQSEATTAIKEKLNELGDEKTLDLIKQDSEKSGQWNTELEADYLRLKKNVSKNEYAKASAERVAAISLSISKSRSQKDIEGNELEIQKAIESGEITAEQGYKELESNEGKRRTIISQNATALRDKISLLSALKGKAVTGTLDKESLQAEVDVIGQENVDALLEINAFSGGSTGFESLEYMEVQDKLESFVGGIRGMFTDKGRKVWDADSGTLKNVSDLIGGEFTQDAKLKLMSTFAAAMYTDATYSDISVFANGGHSDIGEEFDLDAPQRTFAKHLASKLFAKTAYPGKIPGKIDGDSSEQIIDLAKEAASEKSLLTAEDSFELLQGFWNEDKLNGITDESLESEMEKFDNLLNDKVKKSASRRLEAASLKYRRELSRCSSER